MTHFISRNFHTSCLLTNMNKQWSTSLWTGEKIPCIQPNYACASMRIETNRHLTNAHFIQNPRDAEILHLTLYINTWPGIVSVVDRRAHACSVYRQGSFSMLHTAWRYLAYRMAWTWMTDFFCAKTDRQITTAMTDGYDRSLYSLCMSTGWKFQA